MDLDAAPSSGAMLNGLTVGALSLPLFSLGTLGKLPQASLLCVLCNLHIVVFGFRRLEWSSRHHSALPECVFDLAADCSIVRGDFVEVAKSQRRLPSLSAGV